MQMVNDKSWLQLKLNTIVPGTVKSYKVFALCIVNSVIKHQYAITIQGDLLTVYQQKGK